MNTGLSYHEEKDFEHMNESENQSTMKEITEGNKLIAEFMGLKFAADMTYYEHDGEVKQVAYHSSWDWLMPVVEKIGEVNVNIGSRSDYERAGTTIIISLLPPNQVEMWNETGWSYRKSGNSLIEQVWLGSVQFIQWYNQNKTK